MSIVYMAFMFICIFTFFAAIIQTIHGLIRPHKMKLLGNNRRTILIRGVIIIVLSFIATMFFSSMMEKADRAAAKEEAEIKAMQAANAKARAEAAAKAAEDARKAALAREQAKTPEERIQELFSPWDGSAPVLVRATKAEMHDPKSFEHVSTTYTVQNDGNVRVVMRFRGKNVLGATVMQTAVGNINPNTKKMVGFGVQ